VRRASRWRLTYSSASASVRRSVSTGATASAKASPQYLLTARRIGVGEGIMARWEALVASPPPP
jgi:hypothetical protein